MKLNLKQITFVSLILVFSLGLRIFRYHTTASLNTQTIILSVLILPILILIYYSLLKITKDNYSSLFALTIAAVMPIEFNSYLSVISAIFFFLTFLVAIMIRKDSNNWRIFLIFPIIASLMHFSAILLAPIFTVYIVLLALEHDTLRKEEVLFIAMTIIASLLIVLSFFGLPKQNIITSISALTLFALVGTRPVIFGVAGAYYGIRKNISQSLIFASSAGVVFFLLSSNIIPTNIGLAYLFLSLAALGGIFFIVAMRFIKISRFNKFYKIVRLALFAFILLTGLIHWI